MEENIALAVIVAPTTREIIGTGIFDALDITSTYTIYHINDSNICGLFSDKMLDLFIHPGLPDIATVDVHIKVPDQCEWGSSSANSKLVLKKVKGQTVQGQTA